MNLEKFIPENHVIKLTSTEKQPALKELVAELQNLGLIENKDRYYAQVVHRESLENTGIGNRLAIPHARSDSITKFITVIGICNDSIDYQSMDNKPVKYIMLSLFPTTQSTQYLYFIGMMARIFNNRDNDAFLNGSPAPEELYTFLNGQCEAYFNTLSNQDSYSSNESELTGVPSSDLDLMIRLDRLYNLNIELDSPPNIVQKIDELKKLIDNRLLTYYERMIKKKNNPFAVIEKNSCTGCHMGIPPVNIIKLQDRDGIQVCTYCGRFLIML
ncbi:MAG: hypothetical protein CVV49_02180 [Spirochaetae bacterium HGW-Spirochaetae-5]|nr:MAG: hypothetical protein CVV49_02180 [Spirochaetae bacterium HGW-Spirochaetae-5]